MKLTTAIGLFLAIFLIPVLSFSQTAKEHLYRAQVIGEEPYVYEKPNFDSKILQNLKPGKIYNVSAQLFGGAFYRIRGEGGVLGYVSDADVKPLWKGAVTPVTAKGPSGGDAKKKASDNLAANTDKKPEEKKKERPDKKKRPFQYTQFVGLQYAQIEYQEETMGDKRKESMGFYGAKISGPDLVLEGIFPTEINFLFYSGAPSYYERLTGKGGDGWIVMMNFLFESYYPQGKNALAFMGFGPMLRYSKFNVSMMDSTTGKTQAYSMEDIGAGAIFNGGIGVRLGEAALRGEIQYHWEKQSYLGVGLALQMAF